MRRFTLIWILLLFTTPLFSQYSYREVLSLPWGVGELAVGFRKAPGGQFGPMSFGVHDDTILVLDSQNKQLKLFQNDTLLQQKELPSKNVDDFGWRNSNHYFLLSDNALLEIAAQKVIHTYYPDSPRNLITSVNTDHKTRNVYAILNESNSVQATAGKRLSIAKGQAVSNGYGQFVSVIKKDWQSIVVSRSDRATFEIHSPKRDLATAKFLGSTPDGDLYIYLEKIRQQAPLIVDRVIHRYTADGSLKARFSIPTHAFTTVFKEFYVDDKGNLFQMISAEDGIHIIGWYLNGELFKGIPTYSYPEKFSRFYHYNLIEEETPQSKKASSQKKRK